MHNFLCKTVQEFAKGQGLRLQLRPAAAALKRTRNLQSISYDHFPVATLEVHPWQDACGDSPVEFASEL